ncbi:MAG: SDR family NAD(P)-dependent oxidoreductase [Candidatus Lambdaproteobacteria bacterium]|nr:SDR family NAD(P)-dependent oxidoreductase [Candidatus Lambdaproteobacteria bacterium]
MLEGKVAIVTGAGRGIGKEIAKLMAKYGAKVVVNDPGRALDGAGDDKGPADEVVAEIKKAGGQAVTNYGSVTSFEDCTGMVKQAIDTFGGLHILVNNAGILRDRMLHKMSPEDWKAVIDVHLNGHFNTIRACINHFREQQYGRIINFSSGSGMIGQVGQTNYGAAKLGTTALVRILAKESEGKNITVNAVCPSAATRMTESVPMPKDPVLAEARRKRMASTDPSRIAPLVVYLASEDAKDITGQVLGIRAGELYCYNLAAPGRMLHHEGGWTPEMIRDVGIKALIPFLTPVRMSRDVMPNPFV